MVFDIHDGRVVDLLHNADGTLDGTNRNRGVSFKGTWKMADEGVRCLETKRGKSCVNMHKSADGKYYTARPDKTEILSKIVTK